MQKLVAILALVSIAARQEELPKPTKQHELLKDFEGTWDGSVRLFMEPGKEPAVSKGVMTQKLCCGGLWVVFDWKGDMMGMPFEGHGTMGYDVKKQKFVGSWIDSWTTSIQLSEGGYDEKTKTFTMVSEDEKKNKRKEITEIKSADHHVMKFMTEEGGKEMMMMEIEFKRRK